MKLHRGLVLLTQHNALELCSNHESRGTLGYGKVTQCCAFPAKLISREDQNCLNKRRKIFTAAGRHTGHRAHAVTGTSSTPKHISSNDDEESYVLKMMLLVTAKTWTVRS